MLHPHVLFCLSHTHTHTHTLQILLRNVHRNNQLSSCLELNINLPVSWYTHMQNWERSPERDFQSQKDIPQDTVRQTEKKSSKEKRKKNYLKKKNSSEKVSWILLLFCQLSYYGQFIHSWKPSEQYQDTLFWEGENLQPRHRPCKSTFGNVC